MEGGTKNPELASWGQDSAPLLTLEPCLKKKNKISKCGRIPDVFWYAQGNLEKI